MTQEQRAAVANAIEALIAMLDAFDAPDEDREPECEDEGAMCEDEGADIDAGGHWATSTWTPR